MEGGDWRQLHQKMLQLSGPELNQTLAKLNKEQVGQWLGGLDHSKNGLLPKDKLRVFNNLAQNVSGRELGRVLEQLVDSGGMVGDSNVQALGQSIANEASDQAKAAFVKHALQGVEPGSTHGVAIAQALGGLREQPAMVEELLRGMTDSQLKDVVSQATQKNVSVAMTSEASPTLSTSYNAQPMASILDAVSNIHDTGLKANVAAASYDMLNEIEGLSSTSTEIVSKNGSDAILREGLAKLGVFSS